jgi:hypothetical protein
MSQSLKSMSFLATLTLSVLLVSCDKGNEEPLFDDLFFGIAIGTDSSDVSDAIDREDWYLVSDTEFRSREPALFFHERDGNGQFVAYLSGDTVSALSRHWIAQAADRFPSPPFHDSLRSVFNRRFQKVAHEAGSSTVNHPVHSANRMAYR